MKDEALKLALEALENAIKRIVAYDRINFDECKSAITAIKQALAAPVQPVDNGPDYEDGPDEEGFSGPRPWNSFAQPAPVQEPAFHGFMDEENCCVHICYTPWAPRMTDGKLPTAYYTIPPAAHQCKYPTCHNEEYQQALAEQLKQELVTGAAQRQWVGLTELEKADLWKRDTTIPFSYADAIEAKLKEKNK